MRVVWLGVSVVWLPRDAVRPVRDVEQRVVDGARCRTVNVVASRVLPVPAGVRYVVNGPLFARRVALELLLAGQVVPPGEFPLLLEEQLVLVHRMLRPRRLAVHVLLRDQPVTIRVKVRGCARRNASDA